MPTPMKPSEKRTSTQLGLGKVGGEPRQTTKRERVDQADAEPASVPPISAPPPSGGPISGAPAARHTKALESNPPRHTRSIESSRPRERGSKDDVEATRNRDAERAVERTPSPPPALARSDSRPGQERVERIDRVEIDDERPPGSVRGVPSSRTPIEVTQVDTKRLPRTGASSRPSDARDGRFAAEEPTGRRPIAGRVRSDERADPRVDAKPAGSRIVDGRPVSKRAESGRPASGRPESGRPESARPVSARPESGRPVSGRPESGRPVSGRPESGRADSARPTNGRPTNGRPASIRPPPRGGSTAPAKSARVSIREDNVGGAVKADAVGASGRAVPKLLKTKAEIAAAPIDHRAGFLLAHVDGVTTVAGLVDICGMPEDQVNEILDRLRRLGIVAVR